LFDEWILPSKDDLFLQTSITDNTALRSFCMFVPQARSTRRSISSTNREALIDVPSKSRQVHQKLMFVLSEIAVSELSGFNARSIATTLNALAKRSIRNQKLFQKAGEAAIPILETFNSQDLANVVNGECVCQDGSSPSSVV
jgi:hypothetical protein